MLEINKDEVLERILNAMKEQNFTDYRFASLLKLNMTIVSDWKRKKSNSYMDKINEISELLNRNTKYFLYGNEQPLEELDEETRVKQEIFDKHKVLFSTKKNLTSKQLETMFKLMDEMFGDKDE